MSFDVKHLSSFDQQFDFVPNSAICSGTKTCHQFSSEKLPCHKQTLHGEEATKKIEMEGAEKGAANAAFVIVLEVLKGKQESMKWNYQLGVEKVALPSHFQIHSYSCLASVEKMALLTIHFESAFHIFPMSFGPKLKLNSSSNLNSSSK